MTVTTATENYLVINTGRDNLVIDFSNKNFMRVPYEEMLVPLTLRHYEWKPFHSLTFVGNKFRLWTTRYHLLTGRIHGTSRF
jgi:hypothetical protein